MELYQSFIFDAFWDKVELFKLNFSSQKVTVQVCRLKHNSQSSH